MLIAPPIKKALTAAIGLPVKTLVVLEGRLRHHPELLKG